MPGFYKSTPNETHAYYTDGTDEWYGWAAKGTATSASKWQIVKIDYTGDNWIEKFPQTAAGQPFTDLPHFKWDDVSTYTYGVLGT